MAGNMGMLYLLALCVWVCSFCYAVPQWSNLPQVPQASVFQQSEQGGIPAQSHQAFVLQPSDQRFLTPQAQQPRTQQPRTQQPRTQQPRTQQPRTQQPRTQQPRTQQPRTQQPRTQQPRTQQPRTRQRGIPAQSNQAFVFQPRDQRFLTPRTPEGIPAQKPQDVFQPSDQFLPQDLQPQTEQFPLALLPKQPVVQAEPLDKCAVADYEQIQCGPPGISAAECEAINCCFDGLQCYYGKVVTVQCIRDGQFVVVVARDVTWPSLSLDTVRLLGGSDPPCAPVGSTPSFAIYQFPVTACGTSMMEDNGYVVYENRMTSSYEVGIGQLGSITRDSHFELLFQCRYSGTAVQALVVEVNTAPPPPPIAAPGPLRVELRLANGQCVTKGCAEEDAAYTSYYSDADYPVTRVLRQPVYVEVHLLERTDPNIVLMLGHCWATSTPDPLSLPHWDLLVNGCPYQDDRYLTTLVPVDGSSGLQFPTHYKRFIVKMFTFVDPASLAPLQETVFIHCSTAVCHPSFTGSCEQSCARQRRDVYVKATYSKGAVVSSGEINFVL